MSEADSHLVLIVEDDVETADELSLLLEALGHRSIVRVNRSEAETLIEATSVCLVILDLEIPSSAGSSGKTPDAGLSLLEVLRRRYPETRGTNGHVLQVIVYSAHGEDHPIVRTAMQRGANDVVGKSPGSRVALRDAIRMALRRSGRVTHDRCDAPAHQPVLTSYYDGAQLDVTGDAFRDRNEVVINNRSFGLPNEQFGLLVALVAARLDGQEGWVTKSDLERKDSAENYYTASRLRKALEPFVPASINPVEAKSGRVRLDPAIECRIVRWRKLTEHGDVLVRSAAGRALSRT